MIKQGLHDERCFGDQYKNLMLYLHQKLDENNSSQQVQTAGVGPLKYE